MPETPQPLAIESFDDLIAHEPEILQRISQLPNGGHLFLVHPVGARKSAVGSELRVRRGRR